MGTFDDRAKNYGIGDALSSLGPAIDIAVRDPEIPRRY